MMVPRVRLRVWIMMVAVAVAAVCLAIPLWGKTAYRNYPPYGDWFGLDKLTFRGALWVTQGYVVVTRRGSVSIAEKPCVAQRDMRSPSPVRNAATPVSVSEPKFESLRKRTRERGKSST